MPTYWISTSHVLGVHREREFDVLGCWSHSNNYQTPYIKGQILTPVPAVMSPIHQVPVIQHHGQML
jgi:hypothetical protein